MEAAPKIRRPAWVWAIHGILIINFLAEMVYAGYMVFAVFAPAGHSGPLYEVAREIPFEDMVTRRLYALEFWIATAGLAIYLAITEIVPRSRASTPA